MEENKVSNPEVTGTAGSDSKAKEDIDHLLDSALEEMSAPKPNSAKAEESSESEGPVWSEEFVRDTTSKFEEMLRTFMANAESGNPSEEAAPTSNPQMNQFAQIAMRLGEACMSGQAVGAAPTPAAQEVKPTVTAQEDPLADIIRQLSEGAQALRDVSEEDMLANMLSGLGFAPNANPMESGAGLLGGLEAMLPMMETMMKGLVSKEVLYPPLKELCEKYPEWLAQNESTTPAESFASYRKQFELMTQVCDELDTEQESDSEERKTERFLKVMKLMQEIQACGPPPPELASESSEAGETPEVTSGANQMPPEQCNIM